MSAADVRAGFLKKTSKPCHPERRASSGEAGISAKSKDPENLFLPMLRQGVLLKTFSSATYCLAVALTYREKAWREFPDVA
jgi:hypothetical protein